VFDAPAVLMEAPCMAVSGGRVSFVARSRTASAAEFTRRLGLQPSQSWELGERSRLSDSDRDHAAWIVDRDLEVEEQSLDAGLLRLLAIFDGREADLAELSHEYEMSVHCYGASDSTQGGFVMGSQVMRRMGELGLDLLCTIYLEEAAREQP